MDTIHSCNVEIFSGAQRSFGFMDLKSNMYNLVQSIAFASEEGEIPCNDLWVHGNLNATFASQLKA